MKKSFKKFAFFSLLILFAFINNSLLAQTGIVKGQVLEQIGKSPIPFANVRIEGIGLGAVADFDGKYLIENVPVGIYSILCTSIGYKNFTAFEIEVGTSKARQLDFELEQNSQNLDSVSIVSSPFNRTEESPVSMRTIGSAEIIRSPGGNRDISKVIQNFPGVGSTVSFRNDILVRGGAPNENRFYLDGIEVPNINHFATQGSSGGPVGMMNVNFIREVDFYSGAFPANRGNALSSVMEFKQIKGNKDKLSGNASLGSSDVGLTLDGPLGKSSNFIFSIRRSYLQLLFKALALPFLPTYNDAQFKQNIVFKNKSTLSIIGLGAIDQFALNKSVNNGLSDSATIERNNYILGYLPVNNQWNYTLGASYKILSSKGYTTFVLSRNQLNNSTEKYQGNTNNPADKILDYQSTESENKARIERTNYDGDWKINYGLGYENALYTNSTFRKIEYQGSLRTDQFNSKLSMNKFAYFAQLGKKFMDEKFQASFGLRSDFTDYSNELLNPISQLSPRISFSYSITRKLFLNFNTGRYFQLPSYTVLGYRDSTDQLINQSNKIKYIQCDHLIPGLEFNPSKFSKITLEAFYKKYSKYPFLLKDSISLANLGGDFGVIGNEEATSISQGRTYGIELFLQQKLSKSVYGILSYTFFRSEFQDKSNVFIPSSWDNGHILNVTAGKRLKRNWELGMKFRLLGGAPYTAYDYAITANKNIWDVTGQGVFDWSKINQERYPLSHGLDVRLDKKWYFKKWALNAYLDIQNIYNFKTKGPSYLDVVRDANGNPVSDPVNPSAYQLKQISNENGTVLPSIGITAEF